MLAAHDPILFYNKKLVLYFTFCFDVDDPSKYICLGVLCQKKRLDRCINEENNRILFLLFQQNSSSPDPYMMDSSITYRVNKVSIK